MLTHDAIWTAVIQPQLPADLSTTELLERAVRAWDCNSLPASLGRTWAGTLTPATGP